MIPQYLFLGIYSKALASYIGLDQAKPAASSVSLSLLRRIRVIRMPFLVCSKRYNICMCSTTSSRTTSCLIQSFLVLLLSRVRSVDQLGLIHGISLSLLSKYLPFVLIVCVADLFVYPKSLCHKYLDILLLHYPVLQYGTTP